jgi:hypothetical protein
MGSEYSGDDMEAGRTNFAEDQTRIWAQQSLSGEQFAGDAIFIVEAARDIDDDDFGEPSPGLHAIRGSSVGGTGVIGLSPQVAAIDITLAPKVGVFGKGDTGVRGLGHALDGPISHIGRQLIAAIRTPLRCIAQLLAVAAVLAFPQLASGQCAGIPEEGRWRNLDNTGEPSYIDVRMIGSCGDQILNGEPTVTSLRYTMRVWVRQSTGKFYGRPTVTAVYRRWKGTRWLQGNVSTGGYQDQMWLQVEQRAGRSQLHVVIKHQSLDSKPSAQSEYWFIQ